MKTVTLLEFRNNAARILEAVENGEEILLTRRGKPSVRLVSARTDAWVPPSPDDPIFHLDDYAVAGDPSLPPLTHEAAERLIYGA